MGKPYEDYVKSVPGWVPRRSRQRRDETESRV
jgi:hypothetical protein